MHYPPVRSSLLLLTCLVGLVGCGQREAADDAASREQVVAYDLPPIETRADSIALRIMDAHGGVDTWRRIRYVRFDFGFDDDEGKRVARSHLWDRFANRYRVEWQTGADSTVVALFDTDTREGEAYLNGVELPDSLERRYVERAYEMFINDTYWLMAPMKLLDPGVERAYVPDSSSADYAVITTTYHDVGLTPDDQFWFWMDRQTGMLDHWAYQLQGRKNRPPTMWNWRECESFETVAGTVMLCPRKTRGQTSIMTDNISLPADVPADAFTNPRPMFGG
jgi:hypothetical protein